MNNDELQAIKEAIISALQPYFLEDEDYTDEIESVFDEHLKLDRLKSVLSVSDFSIDVCADFLTENIKELSAGKFDDLEEAIYAHSDSISIDTGRGKITLLNAGGSLEDQLLIEEFAEKMSGSNPNQLKLIS